MPEDVVRSLPQLEPGTKEKRTDPQGVTTQTHHQHGDPGRHDDLPAVNAPHIAAAAIASNIPDPAGQVLVASVTTAAPATAATPPGTRRCGATIATRHSGRAIASTSVSASLAPSTAPTVTAAVHPTVSTTAAPMKWDRRWARVPAWSALRFASIQVGSMIVKAASSREVTPAEPHNGINDEL